MLQSLLPSFIQISVQLLQCIEMNARLNCTGKRVKPTCGSDGVWYKNTCTLRLHRCLYEIELLQRDISNLSCKYYEQCLQRCDFVYLYRHRSSSHLLPPSISSSHNGTSHTTTLQRATTGIYKHTLSTGTEVSGSCLLQARTVLGIRWHDAVRLCRSLHWSLLLHILVSPLQQQHFNRVSPYEEKFNSMNHCIVFQATSTAMCALIRADAL